MMLTKDSNCPLLDEENLSCKASIYRIVYTKTGKRVEYQPLTRYEVDKCRSALYRKCPNFISSRKVTCVSCGYGYHPKEAGKVTVGNENFPVCPQCGSTSMEKVII